jgi:protein TonB
MTAEELLAAIHAVDAHLTPLIYRPAIGKLALDIRLFNGVFVNAPNVVTPAAASPQAQIQIPDGTPRVSNQVLNSVTKVPPVYPPTAKAARVQGPVQLDVLVGPDGQVLGINTISGPPLLTQAATDAVKQWVYKPYLVNGQPTAFVTTVDVNFTLNP